MTRHTNQPRPGLLVPRDEAKQRIATQIEKAKNIPNASVNENDEVRRWYDFTAELLRQICTTDELSDEFTGRSSISFGGEDISTGSYLRKLTSISERLDLYPEQIPLMVTEIKDPVKLVETLINKFHIVARQLRQRHDNRPTLDVTDEYDVQDLFHCPTANLF